MSIPKFLDTHTADEDIQENSSHLSLNNTNPTRDLPLSTKYFLIAIYLATQNPIKYDRMLYDKQSQGKKKSTSKKLCIKKLNLTQLKSNIYHYHPINPLHSIVY